MPRISLITTFWKRPALTRVFARYYSQFAVGGYELVLHAAISPEDPDFEHLLASAEQNGFTVHLLPNIPLCDKHNRLLEATSGDQSDAVLTLGSDDFITHTFLKSAWQNLVPGRYVTPASVWFLDPCAPRVIRRGLGQNGIRMFHVEQAKALNWQFWHRAPKAMAMDAAMDMRVGETVDRFSLPVQDGSIVLDVKDPTTSRVRFRAYDRNLKGSEEENPIGFMARHFPGLWPEIEVIYR